MPQALRCPGCGTELSTDAPEGLCPGCLLGEAMRRGSGSGAGPGPGATTPISPGPAFVPPRPEDLAPHFPHLEILELLGRGGMGVVYKARQLRLDRLVALKILPPELGHDPAFAERFAREARAMARLTHPRIVGVHDFGESGGLFYLVMEYVEGANLRGLMRGGCLRPEEALRIVPQVCDALQYAHEEGVVHRDIKPENILLDRRGNVKIADFGLAKLLGMMTPDSVLTGSRQVVGTLRYMAPEQMERPLHVDHRADIYSLGVVFYEMLTGELPIGRFDPPSKRARVDVRLDDVVFRALEKEPERRYQHASEVKTRVERLSGPAERPGNRPVLGERPGGPAGLGREAWLLLPLLAVALIAADLFIFDPRASSSLVQALMMFLTVMAIGAGAWGVWRFLREEHEGRPARRAGGATGRPAVRRNEAWLLVPLACATCIAYVYADRGLYPTVKACTGTVAAGVGLWALWRFVRGDRAGKVGGSDSTVRRNQAWLLVPLACATYIAYAYTTERLPDTFRAWTGVLAAGVGLWASWRFLRGHRADDAGPPMPAARWWWKMAPWILLFGACAIVTSIYFVQRDLNMFTASAAMTVGVGLSILFRFLSALQTSDVDPRSAEIEHPKPDPDRDLDTF